jgi:uncharacterized zinc-type alcohol dehydrogenase-like protein
MIKTNAYAAMNQSSPLIPFSIERRSPGPTDVQLEILFCGVCHSDLHQARNEWRDTIFPCVPGHEIVGKVVKTGTSVQRFKEGDIAAVGCMVGSCGKCESCRQGEEQYCDNLIDTYNSRIPESGEITYGGYSERIVVQEKFVLRVPDNLDLAATAPLLCAGITTYSPLRYWKIGKGMKVGVIGLGGLGHVAVKLAHAWGAEVVLFTTSPDKRADAIAMGAHEVVISSQPQMEKLAGTFDFLLDTVSAEHDLNAYLQLLKRNATMTLVGASPQPMALAPSSLLSRRRKLAGSLIGGIRETQEMLDFCAEHRIACDIEIIPIQKINEAYERMLKNDVRYRFVIDCRSLKTM